MPSPLSPTPRTTVARGSRARTDREILHEVLAEGLLCHLGVVVDAVPRVLPTVFAHDPAGPDRGGTLYVHGSVVATSLVHAPHQTVCVAITLLDGLVLARSGFNHSMNYRSAVVVGTPRQVGDPAERDHALTLLVDQLVPGRSATLRAHSRKELAATAVLAVPLHEASVKVRVGDPADDPDDVAAGGWAGVLPLRVTADAVIRSADCPAEAAVPVEVTALATRSWPR